MTAGTTRSSAQADATALTIGTILSGLMAYGFIAMGTRAIGPDAFAPVSILWTFWAASAAFITFPVQHWAIRTVESDGHEEGVRNTLPALLGLSVALGMVLLGLLSLGREQIFHSDALTFPALTALLPLGSVAMGVNRGMLAGRQRFLATALAIVGENAIRVALAFAVILNGGDAVGLGIALVGGFAIAAIWPDSFVPRSSGEPRSCPDPWWTPIRFLGGVAGGSVASQTVLTGSPVALTWLGGSPRQVTSLFAAMALARAPYMVGTGVAPRVTSALTTWVVQGRVDQLRQLRVAVAIGTIVGSAAAGVVAWLFGGAVLRIAFGHDVTLASPLLTAIACGVVATLAALVLTLLLIARGLPAHVTRAWLAGMALAGVLLVAGPADPLTRVVVATVVAQVVAMVLLWSAVGGARHQPKPRPTRSEPRDC